MVTGGARGIGYAISQRLLQSGASVCLWDVDTEAAAEAVQSLAEHGAVITQTVELTDADSVQAATDAGVPLSTGVDPEEGAGGIKAALAAGFRVILSKGDVWILETVTRGAISDFRQAKKT